MMLKTANCLVVAIALLSGCNDSSNGFKSENLKFIAPSFNPEIKALVLADGFGATTSEIFSVRIRQGNRAPEEVLKLDHVRNLTVQWKGEKSLEINMDYGKIFNFTNFFYAMDQNEKFLYEINIRLANRPVCSSRGALWANRAKAELAPFVAFYMSQLQNSPLS